MVVADRRQGEDWRGIIFVRAYGAIDSARGFVSRVLAIAVAARFRPRRSVARKNGALESGWVIRRRRFRRPCRAPSRRLLPFIQPASVNIQRAAIGQIVLILHLRRFCWRFCNSVPSKKMVWSTTQFAGVISARMQTPAAHRSRIRICETWDVMQRMAAAPPPTPRIAKFTLIRCFQYEGTRNGKVVQRRKRLRFYPTRKRRRCFRTFLSNPG